MMLNVGDSGLQVKHLQYALRIMCCNPNIIDGFYGRNTQLAVQKYQQKFGFTINGIIDNEIWNHLVSQIKLIQKSLKEKGFYDGEVTGISEEKTYNSVIRFQKNHGLIIDGMVGNATRTILFSPYNEKRIDSSILQIGSKGELTKYLQRILIALGYQVSVNGVFSQNTSDAISDFQQACGLEVDSIVGNDTWLKLFERYRMETSGIGNEDLVMVAKHELEWGFIEDENNITPYGQWYGMNGSAWCAMFVSYCAYQARIIDVMVPKFAWCRDGVKWYRNREKYYDKNSGYIPKRGDIVFFYNMNKGRVGHTGIVVGGNSENIKTIEGNTSSNRVEMRIYRLNNKTIDGYGSNGGMPIFDKIQT